VLVFGKLYSLKGYDTLFEKQTSLPTLITEYSTAGSAISNCCIKLTTPKPYHEPINYKTVRAFTENLDTSCEIQQRWNETIQPKTKYLTVVEVNRNKTFEDYNFLS
jgi:hypothetical protein